MWDCNSSTLHCLACILTNNKNETKIVIMKNGHLTLLYTFSSLVTLLQIDKDLKYCSVLLYLPEL